MSVPKIPIHFVKLHCMTKVGVWCAMSARWLWPHRFPDFNPYNFFRLTPKDRVYMKSPYFAKNDWQNSKKVRRLLTNWRPTIRDVPLILKVTLYCWGRTGSKLPADKVFLSDKAPVTAAMLKHD